MTVFAQTSGQRKVAAKSLTDTSDFDLITSAAGETITLDSVVACNKTSGSLNFDLVYVAGGVSYYVLHNEAIAAHKAFQLTDHNLALPAGAVLRIKSSASGLDVTAVYILNHASTRT